MEHWKEILVPLLVLGGYLGAKARPTSALRVGRAAAVISAALLASVVISGVWRPSPATVDYHRFAAHGLVIFNWIFVFLSIGIAFRLRFRVYPWRTTAQITGLVAVLGFTLLSAITGYFGPTHVELRSDDFVGKETHNRFLVLHCDALPVLVSALTFVWFRSFRAHMPCKLPQS